MAFDLLLCRCILIVLIFVLPTEQLHLHAYGIFFTFYQTFIFLLRGPPSGFNVALTLSRCRSPPLIVFIETKLECFESQRTRFNWSSLAIGQVNFRASASASSFFIFNQLFTSRASRKLNFLTYIWQFKFDKWIDCDAMYVIVHVWGLHTFPEVVFLRNFVKKNFKCVVLLTQSCFAIAYLF